MLDTGISQALMETALSLYSISKGRHGAKDINITSFLSLSYKLVNLFNQVLKAISLLLILQRKQLDKSHGRW